MARATKEESEITRGRVLGAARTLFSERGYASVRLEEVAAEAEVTRGAIYHHFASRKHLFSAVHADVQRAVGEQIDAHTSNLSDPWEMLEVGCRVFLTESVSDENRQVMLVDGPAQLGWSKWRSEDAVNSGKLLEEILAELESQDLISVPSIGATAALLSGAMNEAALWIAETQDRSTSIDEAWIVLKRFLESCRPPIAREK